MPDLFIQLLGNSPTLIAVLLLYSKFDKRCALIERDIETLQDLEQLCGKKRLRN